MDGPPCCSCCPPRWGLTSLWWLPSLDLHTGLLFTGAGNTTLPNGQVVMYAAVTDDLPGLFGANSNFGGFYRSLDGGNTWQ